MPTLKARFISGPSPDPLARPNRTFSAWLNNLLNSWGDAQAYIKKAPLALSPRRSFTKRNWSLSFSVRVAQSSSGRNGIVAMIAKAAETFRFDAIDDVLSDIAKGRMVIVTDDADRENEGDLVMAAEQVTPEAVNFMATHGRGLICVPIANERAEQLGLQRMVAQNRETHRTDFTVSVDAARGVTTGISAYDRATTILAIANPKSSPEDLNQPGHVFPLRAKDGGVLRRAGHTEAAVDLARMAGLQPAGVLCEILHDPKFDRLSPSSGEAGGAGANCENADGLRRFRFTLVSVETRWAASPRACERHDRQKQADTGARAQSMSHRRCFRIAPVRLWKPTACRTPANCRGRQRRFGLHASGRPRHWTRGKNPRLQIAGGRSRYRGG